MIKFLAHHEKTGPLIGLGISRKNIEKLIEGKPIHVQLKDVGFQKKGSILIWFGETEQDMMKELIDGGYISPDTKLHVD